MVRSQAELELEPGADTEQTLSQKLDEIHQTGNISFCPSACPVTGRVRLLALNVIVFSSQSAPYRYLSDSLLLRYIRALYVHTQEPARIVFFALLAFDIRCGWISRALSSFRSLFSTRSLAFLFRATSRLTSNIIRDRSSAQHTAPT